MRIRNPFTMPASKTETVPTGRWSLKSAPDHPPVDAFVRRGFLSAAECAELCEAMDQAPRTDGGVRQTGQPETDSIDRTGRRATECTVSDATIRLTAGRICRMAPEIAAHFDQELAEYEVPHFVVYQPGDFYRPHRDRYPDVVIPEPLGRRRVSVVVFLNDSDAGDARPQPGLVASTRRYGGGVLRLCSHEAEDFDPHLAWAVPAESGLLVAFRADTWHEVTPITTGQRYTVVDLLLAYPSNDT